VLVGGLAATVHGSARATYDIDVVYSRQPHWVIANLVGKGGHVRTVPIPTWVKSTVDAWAAARAGIDKHGPTRHSATPVPVFAT
jgi:hypothetical protein